MSTLTSNLSSRAVTTSKKVARSQTLNRYQRAYFYVFIVSLLFCWSPSKLVAYIAPWVAIVLFILITRSRFTLHRVILICVGWLGLISLYALLTPEFAVHSAALVLLTYGSFIFLLVTPTKILGGRGLSERMLAVGRWVLLFQGGWGILQGIASFIRRGSFDGATGDAVAGTIRPFAVYPDFSNPMFAVNVSFLLLLLLPSLITERKGKIAFGVGTLSLILASVLHVLFFLAIAVIVALLVTSPKLLLQKRIFPLVMAAVFLGILASNLLSHNISTLGNFARYTFEGRTVRAQVVIDVFTKMPQEYPWQPIIGLGPGQFSSRASLIGTGLYFGGPQNPRSLPLLPQGMSQPFRDYILERWLSIEADGVNNSSTSQPYFSWLSIFTEFGAIGFSLIVLLVVNILLKLQRLNKRVDAKARFIVLSLGAATIFLFLLGVQENYWEVSQAIFIGLMLLKVQYANLAQLTQNRTALGVSS